ncbi:unnamed protein product [Ilex paraguariensis]|uniref:Peptidase C1A papain C-terminal domain-containing protein n=1 Tax=Ilex paraguariensis TaxID=185542 RepID=A0ABC8UCB1_9AQUA
MDWIIILFDIFQKNARIVSIDGYEDVPPNDEKSLQKAVANQPVSVAIEAGGRAFQLYLSGAFTGLCGTELGHGVGAVGYGTENGVDYWLVRNSWDPNWGENGYIRFELNVANTTTGKCGIAVEPSYPIKEGQQYLMSIGIYGVLKDKGMMAPPRLQGGKF